MLRAMSTHVRVRERLQISHLEAMVQGGAQGIELFCQKEHFDYADRARVREIAGWFRERPGMLHSTHSPIYTEADYGRHMAPVVNLVDDDKRARVAAMDEAKRAIELCPVSRDAVDAPSYETMLGLVYAWTGERDTALTQLEKIIRLPRGPGYCELRFNPWWDEIRTDPRFDTLLSQAALPPVYE